MGTFHPQGDADEQTLRHPRRRGGLQPGHRLARPRAVGHRAALAFRFGDRLDPGRAVLLHTSVRDRSMASLLARLLVDLPRGMERHRHLFDVQPAAVAAGRAIGCYAEARLCGRGLHPGALPNPHRRSPIAGHRSQVPVVRADAGRPTVGAQPAFPRAGQLSGLHRHPPVDGVLLGLGPPHRGDDLRNRPQHPLGDRTVAGHHRGDHRHPRRRHDLESSQTPVGSADARRRRVAGSPAAVASFDFPAELPGSDD